MQGVLGYAPWAAGAVGLPVAIALTVLSTRIGTLAGRYGARPFLVIGPALMAAGQLWLARIPSTSEAWRSGVIPPAATFVDVLPSMVLFAIGISCVVAPLTSTLMNSVPVRNSGVASAINNAVSRVGQPLLGAVIFIVITSSFYASMADRVAGVDVSSPEFRRDVTPLNPPKDDSRAEVVAAANEASTESFHLAMVTTAVLLAAGGAVNWFGLGGAARVAPGERRRDDATEPAAPGG
ncbi:MAG TPA: hypothetical protein VGK63_06410 [Candidatus Limnocylindrales bacterium]